MNVAEKKARTAILNCKELSDKGHVSKALDNVESQLSDIARFYGVDHQLVKAMEELGELQTAIAKYKLATPSAITDAACNLVEEMADVYIMVMQLRLMFSPKKFDEVVKYKLKRQKKRMSMEESE